MQLAGTSGRFNGTFRQPLMVTAMSSLDSPLDTLIADLAHATRQVERAVQHQDWPLVERLQKRRRVLIEHLVKGAEETPLNETQAQQIADIRRQEHRAATGAIAQRDRLASLLGETNQPGQSQRASPAGQRMHRAYTALDRK